MPISSLLFRKKREPNNPMQIPHPPPPSPPPPPIRVEPAALLGLKTLAASDHHHHRHHCVNKRTIFSSPSTTAPPLSASSSMGGDHGRALRETGVFAYDDCGPEVEEEDEEDEEDDETCCWASYGRRRGLRRMPPPITLLARTGKWTCLAAWVLRRTYEDDGRLVIREVKVEHQEYLRANRTGGRLTLQLVRLEHADSLLHLSSSSSSAAEAAGGRVEEEQHEEKRTAPVPVPVASSDNKERNHQTGPRPQMSSLPRRTEKSLPEEARHGVDVRRRVQMKFASTASLMTLSSSMPESTVGGAAAGKGCYMNASSNSLFEMQARMLRTVRS